MGVIGHTLAGSAISGDGESSGAGAVVGAHGVVTGMRARVPSNTLILIFANRGADNHHL